VLRNVTNNALKFSHSGQTITFTAIEQGGQVTVSIRDEGVGMTKETVDSLFQISNRFSKAGTTNEKGTGLGLIFCKEFIENNNGKLLIDTDLGAGTTVSFSLPKNGN
jgi:signal transduction histidine kinase